MIMQYVRSYPADDDTAVFSYADYEQVGADVLNVEEIALSGIEAVGMLEALRAYGYAVPVTRESFVLAMAERFPHAALKGVLDHWDFLHTREVSDDEVDEDPSVTRAPRARAAHRAAVDGKLLPTTFDFLDGLGPVPAHRHANGGGWVADTATVDASAYVGENARVYGTAHVYGIAHVSGTAHVFGNAHVSGTAHVSGNAWVYGNAHVYGDARVYGTAYVSGNAYVSGTARVYGNACVYGNARVFEGTRS